MSKLTLRKTIAQFQADELRQLILEIYDRSKDAKEILDFYSYPDIEKKYEQYLNLIIKEVGRVKHRRPAPRMRQLRSIIRKFSRLQPGDEAVARLMVETVTEICEMAHSNYIEDKLTEQTAKFLSDTIEYLTPRRLLDEYIYRLQRAILSVRPNDPYNYFRNTLNKIINYE